MNNSERMPVIGMVKITVFRNGKITETFTDHNLVVVGGRKLVARAIAGINKDSSGNFYYINQMGIGTGSDTVEDSNTVLTDPITETLLAEDITIPEENQDSVVFTKTFSLKDKGTSGTKTFREAGLYYTDGTSAKLFSRYAFPDLTLQYNDEYDISMEVQWTITVPSSLA